MDLENFKKDILESSPKVQMAPLIDIIFLLLIFFMSAFIFYELETEIDITVPTSTESKDIKRSPGEIIINVRSSGDIIVNQRELSYEELNEMISRISKLYKNQPVIIRGDEETKHKHIIKILDICAANDIWNVSFATMREEGKE